MANKREFKKYADAVGASVCEEMMTAYYNIEGIDKDAVSKAIEKVLGAVGAAKANANIFFDRGRKGFADPKEYSKKKDEFFKNLFTKIDGDFATEIDEALKLFNSAIPAKVKADNKAAAAAAAE